MQPLESKDIHGVLAAATISTLAPNSTDVSFVEELMTQNGFTEYGENGSESFVYSPSLRSKCRWLIACLLLMFFFAEIQEPEAATLENKVRVALQGVLRAHIQAETDNGLYYFRDQVSGDAYMLRLKKLHPVIFKQKETYLLCADFVDDDGKAVLVDYFIERQKGQFMVVNSVPGRRPLFMRIFNQLK
jgi:hypothetical protein